MWRSSIRSRINEADFEESGSKRQLTLHNDLETYSSPFFDQLSDIDSDQYNVQYTPIKYDYTQANDTSSVFGNMYALDVKKSLTKLKLRIEDSGLNYTLTSSQLSLLKKHETFTKNQVHCKTIKGSEIRQNYCTQYYKLSKICLLIDNKPAGANKDVIKVSKWTLNKTKEVLVTEKTDAWQITGNCGTEYNQLVDNSREYL